MVFQNLRGASMTINVSPDPRLQFFGNDGKPLVGGKLYTYAAGTTTLLATYTDWYGTTPNTNPIILDSRGEASVWLGTARYKFVLKDANDVEVYTQDNLIMSPGADGAGAYGTWPIDISGSAATVSGGFVKSIIAGSGIAVDHATGDVTVSLSGSGGAVTSITSAVSGFSFSGTGALTFNGPAPGANGNVLTSNGTSWTSQSFVGTSQPKQQLFTSSGSWTAPAGVTIVRAVVVGGGGAGGGGAACGGTNGGSGGQGGLAIGYYTVTPGTAYTITVGIGGTGAGQYGTGSGGGTSSFASFASATGGTGGGPGHFSCVPGTNGTEGTGSGGSLRNGNIYLGGGGQGGGGAWLGILYGTVNPNTGTAPSAFVLTGSQGPGLNGAGGTASNGAAASSKGGVGGCVYLEWIG